MTNANLFEPYALAALADLNPATLYGGCSEGYTDYPPLTAARP